MSHNMERTQNTSQDLQITGYQPRTDTIGNSSQIDFQQDSNILGNSGGPGMTNQVQAWSTDPSINLDPSAPINRAALTEDDQTVDFEDTAAAERSGQNTNQVPFESAEVAAVAERPMEPEQQGAPTAPAGDVYINCGGKPLQQRSDL